VTIDQTTAPTPAQRHRSGLGADFGLDLDQLARCPIMPTYNPPPVQFVRGEGPYLWDAQGTRYLDFLAGLAVTSLGHAHPAVAEAIAAQAQRLLHVSNLFATEHNGVVAATLDRLITGPDHPERAGQVFFANSGAEANEAAIKLARRYGGPGRHTVVCAFRSFHGRTLAALAATGQPEKWDAFQPLPEGFRHVVWNDLDELEANLDETVAAVLVEPVQGEGGVNPATAEYFQGIQRLCRERDVLFMVDEVQTGLGRTGEWFGFQHFGVTPDVVTMAKALGNGMPIGACWATASVAASFSAGDHATTYGGQPLATAAARAVLGVMEAVDAPARAREMGERVRSAALALPQVTGVRGLGLLLAIEIDGLDARRVAARCLEEGLVVNGVTANALRVAPSLLIEDDHVTQAMTTLGAILADEAARVGEHPAPGASS
jgi:predicted acetylornithine/succinylornithine family transaminase